jgi:hypothetical protein
MVPTSVIQAWQGLQENQRIAVSRSCAKRAPIIFNRWIEAAGLKSFRRESLISRKAGSAARLDAVLFRTDEGQLAKNLLVAYFTELTSEINDRYLALLEAAGNEEQETKLALYAQLSNEFQGSPWLRLYLATALWVEEFPEEEIATIQRLAAELAAAG